jgi:hypothetical protein
MRASTGIWASVGDTSTVFKRARRSADCPTAQSRRDDLEALGYILVYLMRGRLPWQGLKAKRDAKHLLVFAMKQATSASELCAGLPTEFVDYFNYVHDLRDEDRPDYQHLRKISTKLFRRPYSAQPCCLLRAEWCRHAIPTNLCPINSCRMLKRAELSEARWFCL